MDAKSRIKRPHQIRLITAGNAEVGKTSIIKRLCEKRFNPKYQATIGLDFGVLRFNAGTEVRANIFDLSGLPVFKMVRMEFYTSIDAVILIYDLSNPSSFEMLDSWLAEMAQGMDNTSVVCIVCANKCDKKQLINRQEAQAWVEMHKFSHFVVSAQTGEGITEMFQNLIMQVLDVHNNGRHPVALWSSCNYSKEELQAVHQVRWSKTEYEKLGIEPGATREDINRTYRRLAVLLHPDKSTAPGCEEAFKLLASARSVLLKRAAH
ncbi:dnaJ homolog subfamily C member 27-like [Ornithodoros turicata]|uniref:dnaJ homolog subfamily C member 27-like n=1 Tax=Ornithodoros turicata TaxID=34597 RepID=UPI003139957A